MASCAVFCYGEIGVDNIIHVEHLPSPEVAAFPTAEGYHIGGAAANTAVWLARWEVPVCLGGNAIGRDDYGREVHGWLGRYPTLDLRHVEQRDDTVTPFCRVMVTPDGERTFLVYWYPQTPKTLLRPELIEGAQFLALDLYGGDERVAAASLARKAGLTVVVGDVVWPDHPALPLTGIATNSAAYIRQTFPGVDPRQHARELRAVSRGVIVTTDGSDPVHVLDGDSAEFTVQPPSVTPVDATGAGDAFQAGLIFGLLQGWPLTRSVCWGVAAGALGVQQEGAATNPPRREEVAALADSLQSIPAT